MAIKKNKIFNTPNQVEIPFHPVRGYATEEQYQQLQDLKIGADFDKIMRDVEIQTVMQGKVIRNGKKL